MIPFALFTRTVLYDGVVRVDFNDVTWTPQGSNFIYSIPQATHASGMHPRVLLVDKSNHTVTGVQVEYNFQGDILLTATQAVPNFSAFFMGDSTEKPYPTMGDEVVGAGVSNVYLLKGDVLKYSPYGNNQPWTVVPSYPAGVKVKEGSFDCSENGFWFVSTTGDLWMFGVPATCSGGFDTSGAWVNVLSNVKTAGNSVHYNPYGQVDVRCSFALMNDGTVKYAGSGNNPTTINSPSAWTDLPMPETITDMSVTGLAQLFIGESGKVYGRGETAHAEYPNPVATSSPHVMETRTKVGADLVSLNADRVYSIGIGTLYRDKVSQLWYAAGYYPNIGGTSGDRWVPVPSLPSNILYFRGSWGGRFGYNKVVALTTDNDVYAVGSGTPGGNTTWTKIADSVNSVSAAGSMGFEPNTYPCVYMRLNKFYVYLDTINNYMKTQ